MVMKTMTMNGNDDGKCDNYKAMLMVMEMTATMRMTIVALVVIMGTGAVLMAMMTKATMATVIIVMTMGRVGFHGGQEEGIGGDSRGGD